MTSISIGLNPNREDRAFKNFQIPTCRAYCIFRLLGMGDSLHRQAPILARWRALCRGTFCAYRCRDVGLRLPKQYKKIWAVARFRLHILRSLAAKLLIGLKMFSDGNNGLDLVYQLAQFGGYCVWNASAGETVRVSCHACHVHSTTGHECRVIQRQPASAFAGLLFYAVFSGF